MNLHPALMKTGYDASPTVEREEPGSQEVTTHLTNSNQEHLLDASTLQLGD